MWPSGVPADSQFPPSQQSKAQQPLCFSEEKDSTLPLFLSVKRISDPGSNSDRLPRVLQGQINGDLSLN